MKILITGTAGRVGRAIYIKLMREHEVVGMDRTPCSTADYLGDIRDEALLQQALNGVDAVIHTAALHAPHVELKPDDEFESINVKATEKLALMGSEQGIKHFVFTSTTALYGHASTPEGVAGWVDESLAPQPKTIYHRSKIKAEKCLEKISNVFNLPMTVLQMSRCFPEPADLMAVYRLSRGVDARDVASAHAAAIKTRPAGFNRYIISGQTPFEPAQCQQLFDDAPTVIQSVVPELVDAYNERGWSLPTSLDRVYDASKAQRELDWQPKHGFQSVLNMLDDEVAEVLPVINQ